VKETIETRDKERQILPDRRVTRPTIWPTQTPECNHLTESLSCKYGQFCSKSSSKSQRDPNESNYEYWNQCLHYHLTGSKEVINDYENARQKQDYCSRLNKKECYQYCKGYTSLNSRCKYIS